MTKMSCVWQTKINTCLNSLAATYFLFKTEGSVRLVQGTLHSTRQVVRPARHSKRACTHEVLAGAKLSEALVNYTALSMAK